MYIPRYIIAIIISLLFFFPPFVTMEVLKTCEINNRHNITNITSALNYQYWSAINKINRVAPKVIESEIGDFPQSYIDSALQYAQGSTKRAKDMVPEVVEADQRFRLLLFLELGLSYVAIIVFFSFAFSRRPLLKFVSFMIPPLGFLLLLVPERFLPKIKNQQA